MADQSGGRHRRSHGDVKGCSERGSAVANAGDLAAKAQKGGRGRGQRSQATASGADGPSWRTGCGAGTVRSGQGTHETLRRGRPVAQDAGVSARTASPRSAACHLEANAGSWSVCAKGAQWADAEAGAVPDGSGSEAPSPFRSLGEDASPSHTIPGAEGALTGCEALSGQQRVLHLGPGVGDASALPGIDACAAATAAPAAAARRRRGRGPGGAERSASCRQRPFGVDRARLREGREEGRCWRGGGPPQDRRGDLAGVG